MPLMVNPNIPISMAAVSHAQNMGAILRGRQNLPANWLHIPVGYNGSRIPLCCFGTRLHRTNGQSKAPDADVPSLALPNG